VVIVVADGKLRDTELHVEPTFDPNGEIDGIVVTAWDITELRQAMRRIQQLDRVRAILSETNQAIVRVRNADGLLAETCRIAVELGGFELAWVGLTEPNGDVRVAHRAGRDVHVLDDVLISVRDEPSGHGVVGTAIRENRPAVVEDAIGTTGWPPGVRSSPAGSSGPRQPFPCACTTGPSALSRSIRACAATSIPRR
jgi:GAF domain-containing protein